MAFLKRPANARFSALGTKKPAPLWGRYGLAWFVIKTGSNPTGRTPLETNRPRDRAK